MLCIASLNEDPEHLNLQPWQDRSKQTFQCEDVTTVSTK